MPRILELLKDVEGCNGADETCHPVKCVSGTKRGYFNYRLSSKGTFTRISEADLRGMIERGEFNTRGCIRMVPVHAASTAGAAGLCVVKYKGMLLPLKPLLLPSK